MRKLVVGIQIFWLLITSSTFVVAQNAIELRGAVLDETGASLAGVVLMLDDGRGNKTTARTDEVGRYRFAKLAAGAYTLTASAAGFAAFSQPIELSAGPARTIDITLQVVITDQIEVKPEVAGVSTEPDQNLSAIKLAQQELIALPDDRDELLQMLRALAGASEDASVYIDGFRDDRLPSKNSIQAVRINSNPFSSEYSEPGRGRIEVITKPGSERLAGSLSFDFNDESLNARNAAAIRRAPLQVREFSADISGPIIPKRWGFSFEFEREAQDENEQINASVLNRSSFQPQPFFDVVLTPARETDFTLRTDYLIGNKHTIGLRYNYDNEREQNLGLSSGFDLPERAYNSSELDNSLRFWLSSVINQRVINEMRLALSRRHTETRAVSTTPAVIVLDAFSAGANQGSLQSDSARDRLEFTNNLSFTRKTHTIKTGVRAEGVHLKHSNRSNFGGTFTFGSDFERDATGAIVRSSDGQPLTITSLENYRRTLLGLPGYGPSQFSIVRGDPFIGLPQWEIAWFAQDDWRISPRLMLSFGLRHEIETDLDDRRNIAPRLAIAWSADKQNKSVIRVGAGVFFDQLDADITFDALRYNGLRQQQFIIRQPTFFPHIPTDFSAAVRSQPLIRSRAADLDAAREIITNISYERKLGRGLEGSIGYNWQRGVHLLRTRNINAPLPGSTVRPFPNQGPLLEYESTGKATRHELRLNWQYKPNRNLTLFGNYALAWARSDTDSAGGNPASPYDLANEFGRANSDQRHRLFIGGTFNLPGGFRLSPLVQAISGRPFNITTGRDNNGDTLFTDRPTLAAPSDPEAIVTPFGVFNPNPRPGDRVIPRNFGQGPGQINFDLNFAKTFSIGARESKDAKRNEREELFKLTLGANVRNILNHTNLAGFSGVLSSPRFGTANRALAARRVELTLRFSF